jgi:hypothetical protein
LGKKYSRGKYPELLGLKKLRSAKVFVEKKFITAKKTLNGFLFSMARLRR